MGTFYIINNVRIYVYPGDHNPPHFHAFYAEHEIVLVIRTGRRLKGFMPKPQLKRVQVWLTEPGVKEILENAFKKLNPTLRNK